MVTLTDILLKDNMSMNSNKYYTGIGSRKTPTDICQLMTRIATGLKNKGYTLRSGGAEGADLAFENGADNLKEIFLPWKGFNNNDSSLYLKKLEKWSKAEDILAPMHDYWNELTDPVILLHTRNVFQVLGIDLETPSEFVIFWTDNEKSGGTGVALKIARKYNVPAYNLFDKDIKNRLENFCENA